MSCGKPLDAYRPASGGPLSFNRPHTGQAGIHYHKLQIPCGQCILCRLEHARQWAVRITHEATLHDASSFITLTYNDENLPPHSGLRYADLQKFWKRLRKKLGKLRYYAVGEYGDETHRPHYHACLFGHAFTDNRIMLRTQPTLLWTHPMLEEAWGMGNVSVGALTFETAQYTAAYVTKKLGKKRYVRVDEETGELIQLEQPRAFMSLRPAIGREWLTDYGNAVYAHDQVVINGRPQKPPKYYDQWLAKRSEIALSMIKERRMEEGKKLTPDENKARLTNASARAKLRAKRA